MATIRKTKTSSTATLLEPRPADALWPVLGYPTRALIEDQGSPFFVAPELRDTYCKIAASPSLFASIDRNGHSTENRIIDVRRFLIGAGLYDTSERTSRGQAMKTEVDNDRVRRIANSVESTTGVNFDGIAAHFVAVRAAMQDRKIRQESERVRESYVRKYTCKCCNTYEPTTKRRDPGLTGDDRLSKARAAALCDPCWWAILQLAAESGKKTHAAASYFAAL